MIKNSRLKRRPSKKPSYTNQTKDKVGRKKMLSCNMKCSYFYRPMSYLKYNLEVKCFVFKLKKVKCYFNIFLSALRIFG